MVLIAFISNRGFRLAANAARLLSLTLQAYSELDCVLTKTIAWQTKQMVVTLLLLDHQ